MVCTKGCKMPPANRDEQSLHALRKALEQRIGARRYKQWFGTAARFAIEGDALLVEVGSPYLLNWIERHYSGLLKELCVEQFGPALRLTCRVGTAQQLVLSPIPEDVADKTVTPVSVSRKTAPTATESTRGRGRCLAKLSDFVVGPCNELAVAATRQVVDQPGDVSCIYLQSNVGNGKTHLLEGLQRELRRTHMGLQTLLMSADQFTSYFMQAMSTRSTPSFRARFQGIDILLLDDIDFLDNKRGTQEELLQVMKRLEEQGGQVVVTSNRHPRLLTRTSEELISRFQAGLVCRIEGPSEDVRREIVQRHAQRQRVTLSAGAVQFIVSRFTRNVRELEGAVNVLAVWSRMNNRKVGTSAAREVLGRLERDCLKIIRLTDVEQVVCDVFGVSENDLRGTSRKQASTQPRMLAMYLARRLANVPYSEIGEHFGKRNHSTVMSAERKVAAQLASGTQVRLGGETWPLSDLMQTLEDRIRAS